GQELIQGLVNGIMSKLAAVGAAMGKVASKIKGFLPGSPVKEGPLTSWNNGGAGKRLGGMLADGLRSSVPTIADASRAMSTAAGFIAPGTAGMSSPRLGEPFSGSSVAARGGEFVTRADLDYLAAQI